MIYGRGKQCKAHIKLIRMCNGSENIKEKKLNL